MESTKQIATFEEETASALSGRSLFKRSAMMRSGLVAAGSIATLATSVAKPVFAAETDEEDKPVGKGLFKSDLGIQIAKVLSYDFACWACALLFYI